MKTLEIFLFVSLVYTLQLHSQNIIPIPPELKGTVIDLSINEGSTEIFPGIKTKTIGYNGSFLGPTLHFQKGQNIRINVHNYLSDSTSVHWHGLHVAPRNDGSPHNPILPGNNWEPEFTIMDNAATYWYHPHLHGKTMSQVIKGASGMIFVNDEEELALDLPRTYGIDDIPLVFQWKTFSDQKQFVDSDDADNTVLINGTIDGTIKLPAQLVRLRLLNGSSHRFFYFGFKNSLHFKQIAGDASLLESPIDLDHLQLAPGERAEIVIDLSGLKGQSLEFWQYGTLLPQGYPGGRQMMMGGGSMIGPLDNKDFKLMSITIIEPTPNRALSVPNQLTKINVWPVSGAASRSINMTAQPMMSATNFFLNGEKFNMDKINFSVEKNKTEIWTITNQTMMAHPFHLHGNSFYVLSVNGSLPDKTNLGKKDVITIPPFNGSVRLIVRYEDFADAKYPYMYHCHILSHEDGGMMGQFIVNDITSSSTEINSSDVDFNIYPNPIADEFNIVMPSTNKSRTIRVQIINLLGHQIENKLISLNSLNEFNVNTEAWVSGLYMLRIDQGKHFRMLTKL